MRSSIFIIIMLLIMVLSLILMPFGYTKVAGVLLGVAIFMLSYFIVSLDSWKGL